MTKTPEHRILISGAGSTGQRHAGQLRELGMQYIAFCDPQLSEDEVVALKKEHSVEFFSNIEAGLDIFRPNIAYICTLPALHADHALKAAAAGANLFIERPLSHNEDKLDELIETAKEKDIVTMVSCDMRFHPGPRAIKQLLEEEVIGAVLGARLHSGSYLPTASKDQDYRKSPSADPRQGGAILDGIQEIDLVLHYFGPANLLAAAVEPATNIGLSVDGIGELLLRHQNGTISSVHLNFIQRDHRRDCQIIGTEGTIYWDFDKKKVEVYGADGKRGAQIPEPPDWNKNQIYKEETEYFLDCVNRKRASFNGLEEARQALRIALQAQQYRMAS